MMDSVRRRLNRDNSNAKSSQFYVSASSKALDNEGLADGNDTFYDTIDTSEGNMSYNSSRQDLFGASLPNVNEDEPYDDSNLKSSRSFDVSDHNRILEPRGSFQKKSRHSMNVINQLKFSKLDHLYGRDQEVKLLQKDIYVDCKQNSTRQFVLISGEAGVGKSVLAEQLKPAVKKDGGFYLSGKFDLQQQDEPYSAISSACIELMHSLLEHQNTTKDPNGWKFTSEGFQQRVLDTMDVDQISILSNIIPNLASVLGVDYLTLETSVDSRRRSSDHVRSSTTSSFSDTKACLHFAFRALFEVLCDFAPTVFVLHDLQWADANSLEFIESLLLDRSLAGKGIVVMCTYRSEEVVSTDLLVTTIQDLQAMAKNDKDLNLRVTEIVLGNLSKDQVNEMLCDLLSCEDSECWPLAEIVHRKTLGNTYFLVQFLKSLSSDGLLAFCIAKLKWTWDVEKIQREESATDNVIDLMQDKLKKLPTRICQTLPIVACLGASFRWSIFKMVIEHFNDASSIRYIGKEFMHKDRNRQSLTESQREMKSIRFELKRRWSSLKKLGSSSSLLWTEHNDDDASPVMPVAPPQSNRPSLSKPNTSSIRHSMLRRSNSFDGNGLSNTSHMLMSFSEHKNSIQDSHDESTSGSFREHPLEASTDTTLYSPSEFLLACQNAGLLFSTNDGHIIHWEHDRVQEAALALANEAELWALRSQLGEVLLNKLSKDDLERSIFVVVSLLDMNTARGNQRKQIRFAELNLLAGSKAIKASASARAAVHFTQGIDCLPENHWESHPNLSLDLYSMAVEALFCTGQLQQMNEYCTEVFDCKELPLLLKARVYNSHIMAMIAEGRFGDATLKCLDILAKLNCYFPKFFKGLHTYAGTLKARSTAAKNQLEHISSHQIIHDEKQKWSMFLLDTLSQAAHQGHSKLHGLANLRGLHYTHELGVCDWTPPLLAVIGNTLVVELEDFDGAQFYGSMAMSLFDKAQISKSSFSRTSFITSYFVLPHRLASTTCRKIALQGYQAGMKSGDVPSALWCALSYLDISFYVSQDLQSLSADCQMYWQQMKSLKHERIAKYLECLWQLALNVSGCAKDPSVLDGNALKYDEYMSFAKTTKSVQAVYYYDRYQIAAAFWSGDYDKVYRLILRTGTHKGFYEKTFGGSFALYPLYCQSGLSLLSLYHRTKTSKYKRMAKIFSRKLTVWAKQGNPNFKHYCLLVDAESAAIRGQPQEAEKLFKEAIRFAGRRGFTQDQALGNERLGEFFFRQCLNDDATYHFNEAVKLYEKWGGQAKCEQLQKRLQVLSPSPLLEIGTLP